MEGVQEKIINKKGVY